MTWFRGLCLVFLVAFSPSAGRAAQEPSLTRLWVACAPMVTDEMGLICDDFIKIFIASPGLQQEKLTSLCLPVTKTVTSTAKPKLSVLRHAVYAYLEKEKTENTGLLHLDTASGTVISALEQSFRC